MMAGLCMTGISGPIPLTWGEIESFSKSTGLAQSHWERRLMRRLSEIYCSRLAQYRDPKAPPPYFPEDGELARFKASQKGENGK